MLTHIWGDSEADANTIRTHIYALRRLFQEGFGNPLIATVHGRGYRLSLPGEDKPS
jgi:DNA-binding winged helix-turn-helix (wHTH) protein